jgi:hypothetical protein
MCIVVVTYRFQHHPIPEPIYSFTGCRHSGLGNTNFTVTSDDALKGNKPKQIGNILCAVATNESCVFALVARHIVQASNLSGKHNGTVQHHSIGAVGLLHAW